MKQNTRCANASSLDEFLSPIVYATKGIELKEVLSQPSISKIKNAGELEELSGRDVLAREKSSSLLASLCSTKFGHGTEVSLTETLLADLSTQAPFPVSSSGTGSSFDSWRFVARGLNTSLSRVDEFRSPAMPPRITSVSNIISSKEKHKTELCKTWMKCGSCKYGNRCSFAHGNEELRDRKTMNTNYKTKQCRTFEELGQCPYGDRCQYLHKKDVETFQKNFLVFIDQVFGRINESIRATDTFDTILPKIPFRSTEADINDFLFS